MSVTQKNIKSTKASNNNSESKKSNQNVPLLESDIDMSILRKPLELAKSTLIHKQQKSDSVSVKTPTTTNDNANNSCGSSRQTSQSSVTNSPVITKAKNNRANRRSTKKFLPEITLKKLPIASNRTPKERERLNSLTFNVVRDLSMFGICVIDDFIPKERGLYVLKEVCAISKSGLLQDGQLVSNPECKKNVKSIRSDKIAWVTGQENFATNIGSVISDVDYIIVGANRMPNCGKLGNYTINSRTKAMIACYPGLGTHYVKHVDNPNQDGRCITAIYYLNVNWSVEKCGGLLRIFPDGFRDQVANIEPIFNRLLIFWSDRRNPHEVQPSFRTRYAITLWYIDEAERNDTSHETKMLT